MYEEDRRIKRRVREAHAAAGSPSYAELAARISAAHPQAEATESRVAHWLSQGDSGVVIPARLIAPLAEVLYTTVGRLLGVEDGEWTPSDVERVMARMDQIEATHAKQARQEQAFAALVNGEPLDSVDLGAVQDLMAALKSIAGLAELDAASRTEAPAR